MKRLWSRLIALLAATVAGVQRTLGRRTARRLLAEGTPRVRDHLGELPPASLALAPRASPSLPTARLTPPLTPLVGVTRPERFGLAGESLRPGASRSPAPERRVPSVRLPRRLPLSIYSLGQARPERFGLDEALRTRAEQARPELSSDTPLAPPAPMLAPRPAPEPPSLARLELSRFRLDAEARPAAERVSLERPERDPRASRNTVLARSLVAPRAMERTAVDDLPEVHPLEAFYAWIESRTPKALDTATANTWQQPSDVEEALGECREQFLLRRGVERVEISGESKPEFAPRDGVSLNGIESFAAPRREDLAIESPEAFEPARLMAMATVGAAPSKEARELLRTLAGALREHHER